ncbi:MAG: 30S ribosomal protein S16 [Candidatus Moraniibacteriota bacterium]
MPRTGLESVLYISLRPIHARYPFQSYWQENRASYRVVLQEKSQAPGKRHVEILGSHDPHSKTTVLKNDRIQYWLSHGAQASPVVHNLLISQGVIEGKKIARKMPRPVAKEEVKPEVSEETVSESAPPVAEAPVEEAPAAPVEAEAPVAAPEEAASEDAPADPKEA